MVMGQPTSFSLAWADGMYWMKCDDGLHWTPVDVGDRMKIKQKLLTQYVYYAWLFKQPGAVFYHPPKYVKETDYTSVT